MKAPKGVLRRDKVWRFQPDWTTIRYNFRNNHPLPDKIIGIGRSELAQRIWLSTYDLALKRKRNRDRSNQRSSPWRPS